MALGSSSEPAQRSTLVLRNPPYRQWPMPMCTIADGPYGLSGFPGDLHSAFSQKPLEFAETSIHATTDPGDTVWEPFGGLCPLVVVPWVLSKVLAGSPALFRTFVESALYCARKRNYYWLHERQVRGDPEVTKTHPVSHRTPHPKPISPINRQRTAGATSADLLATI